MSLEIDVGRVRRVLLPDGRWHDVVPGSFDVDAYEYHDSEGAIFSGGQDKTVPSTGAAWREREEGGREHAVFCPLTSVQAVAYESERN